MADPNLHGESFDVDVNQSLHEIDRERKLRTLGVVLGLAAVLAIGSIVVIAAYADESEAIRDIKAAQPESNPNP